MQFHSATDHIPRMPMDQFALLVDDIARHGLQIPIVVVDGMIVDGRERHDACLQLGIEPEFISLTLDDIGGDVERYVNQMNVIRRHLPQKDLAGLPP